MNKEFTHKKMPVNITIILGLIFFWLGALTYLFIRIIKHYDRLTAGVTKNNLRDLLEKVLQDIGEDGKRIDKLQKWCQDLEKDGQFHIQKIGLLRFNPFSDTGGDQSFVLSILDDLDNGVVISSLHSRSGTRWYAKSVKKGKGIEHDLSKEEEKVIKEAKKI